MTKLRLLLILGFVGILALALPGISSTSNPVWESEPNNEASRASLIPLNGSGRGSLDYDAKDQVDWWKVEVAHGGRLEVILDSYRNKEDLDLEVYNSDLERLENSTTSKGDEKIGIEVSRGWYYIKVYPYESGVRDYYTLSTHLSPEFKLTDFDDCYKKAPPILGWGAWAHGDAEAKVTCLTDKVDPLAREQIIRVRYKVYQDYSGFWMKWRKEDFDPDDWQALSFWIRGDEGRGFTTKLKVELKIKDWGWKYYYLKNVTDEWQKVRIPLKTFKVTKDYWHETNEFVITFESNVATDRSGAVYIDSVVFQR